MNQIKYAITGATGHLGDIAIRILVRKVGKENVIAIIRNESKAGSLKELGVEIRIADYTDAMIWPEVLRGVDKLLLISSSDITSSRSAQHKNVINGAVKAGVERIAYTSILHADTTTNVLAPDHKATEEFIKNSGIAYSLCRHGWYTENYIETAQNAQKSGAIITSAGNGKIASASREDYAEGDIVALVNDKGNVTHEFSGDKAWDFNELGEILSRIFNKPITVNTVSSSDHIATLQSFGLDEPTAQFVAMLDLSISGDELAEVNSQLSKAIGRPTTSAELTLQNELVH